MSNRILLLLIIAPLLAACDSSGLTNSADRKIVYVPPASTPTAIVLPTGTPEPTLIGMTDNVKVSDLPPGMKDSAHDLLQLELDAAKMRGLQPKSDVKETFISRPELQAQLLAELDQNYSRDDARRDELELWLLRFVSEPAVGLYQFSADMLSEQILGLYDPTKQELFVLDSQMGLEPTAKETLAHEYVHSLQDQHFDLQKLMSANSQDSDRLMAAKAVVEGDATLSSLLYADQYMSIKEFNELTEGSGTMGGLYSRLVRAPDIVTARMYFPYTVGVQFIKTLYTRDGFKAIDAALSDPPHSSEQIMHPEKYLSAHRDEPMPVGLPPLTNTLGAGWTYRHSETIGEFDLGILLEVHRVQNWESASAGWGGGQYDFYQNGNNSLLAMGTRWDTPKDAAEFYDAMRQSLAGLQSDGATWSDGNRFFGLKRSGDRVTYVGGTDKTALQHALGAISP